MSRYSIFSLLRNGLSYHQNWQRQWKSRRRAPPTTWSSSAAAAMAWPPPITWPGARHHQRGRAGKGLDRGGNTARNTTIVRSNYLWDESAALYEKAMKLWEGLSQDLNYNVMFSQRGVMNLAHTLQDVRDTQRRVNANRLNGIDAEFLTPAQVQEIEPAINLDSRYPVLGASIQRRAGVARHDAVAWGYARGADRAGVHIIQNCQVTGIRREGGRWSASRPRRATSRPPRSPWWPPATPPRSPTWPACACHWKAIRCRRWCPSRSPVLNSVIMSNAVHAYISQSDKGDLVIGAGIDQYTGFGQRGSFQIIEGTLGAIVEMFPAFSRVRMNRQWGGIVDVSPDACPIISKTPVQGCTSTVAGARAASRPRRDRAGCTPTPSRATRPTR